MTTAAEPVVDSPATVPDYDAMDVYVQARWNIIPLHRHTDKKADGKSAAKVPMLNDWQKTNDDAASVIEDCRRHGRNVGVRPRADQLIIDVDPRNGGNESFDRLCADTGLDPATCPTVITGGGGQRLYLRKEHEILNHYKTDVYPGIEFLTPAPNAHFAVAAGSVHTSGKHYAWDGTRPPLDQAPAASDKLLDVYPDSIGWRK